MFLPRILPALVAALAVLLPAACDQGPTPSGSTSPQGVQAAPGAVEPSVVAGSGDVAPEVVDGVRAMVSSELVRLREVFAGEPSRPFFVHVHADRDSMPGALAALLHQDSPGFALLGRHQIHIVWGEIRRTGANARGVVVHELVHEMLDQFVAPHGALIPRWFHEGLAQTIAGDTYLGAREEDLVGRAATGRLEAFGSLRKEFPTGENLLRVAYGQSYSYVAWLVREYGIESMLAVARATDDLTSFERALVWRTGRSMPQLEDAWRDHLMHGSGAPWRVLFDQCFSLLLIAALPVLVLALMRRLRSEQLASARLAEKERAEHGAAPVPLEDLPDEPDEPDEARNDDQKAPPQA
ncbi:MAG TPA: hypothetical protein VF384_13320 [Planctomycetota bacterium]